MQLDGTWVEEAKLCTSDGTPSNNFGISVALAGTTAVVGAFHADDRGAAYVFTRAGTDWTETSKLTASRSDAVEYIVAP